jgi:antitoxin component YwqK of YwqJK toxin-antitoxin module
VEDDAPIIHEVRDEKGVLIQSITLKNGVPDGETLIYDGVGQLTHRLMYENGVLAGAAEFFFAGKPLMNTFFKNGLQEGEAIFFSNGIKVGVAYFKLGLFDGDFTSFDAAENVVRVAKYVAGQQEGPCLLYYPDGTLMEESSYKNNLQDGDAIRYFPNGNIMETFSFQNGNPCGFREKYDMDGNLISREAM